MRICFVAHDRPNYRSGPIINLRRLLPELRARGHEPLLLIFYNHEPSSALAFMGKGIECRTRLRKAGYTESHVRWILEQLRDQQPDVFVPNVSVPGYFAARWARQAGMVTVGTMRSDDAFYWGIVDEFVCGRSEWSLSGLVCVSDQLRERVAARSPRHTALTTIASGVPLPIDVSRQELPLRLVYVGRLVQKQKRIRDVVTALITALHALPGSTATIIGEGAEQSWVARTIEESGLNGRLRLAGTVLPEMLHAELVHHHVLVLLSDYEGTPGSVMDAMACGLVPVCLDIQGGVRELVRHEATGLLVPDVRDGWLHAVRRLASDDALRRRLARNARVHIEQRYSLAATVDRWIGFGQQLLQDHNGLRSRNFPVPDRLELPRVHAGLSHEDRRKPGPAAQLKRFLRRLGRALPSRAWALIRG